MLAAIFVRLFFLLLPVNLRTFTRMGELVLESVYPDYPYPYALN